MSLKSLIAALALCCLGNAFAAVEINKATAADLDSIKGIGPGLSGKILEERKKGEFKDWNDVTLRVKGIKAGNASKFSAAGLTVNGASFQGTAAPAVVATKKAPKAEAAASAVKK